MSRLFSFGIVAMSLLPAVAAATAQPGHLDLTFGSEGKRIVGASLPAGSARGPATVLEGPGGALYVVGYVDHADATSAIAIARLSADGEIDTGFGSEGLVEYLPPSLEAAYAYDATFDPQGRLVVVGQAVAGAGHTLVCRFDADGAIDDTFGKPTTPGCLIDPLGQQSWARAVVVQACPVEDGCDAGQRIVAVGAHVDVSSTRRASVAAFENSGSGLQTAFGDQGRTEMPAFLQLVPAELASLAQDHSGELAAGGSLEINLDFAVALALRMDKGGNVRSEFGESGLVVAAFENGADSGRTVATQINLDDHGNIVLAGNVQFGAQDFRPVLARFKSDGFPDLGFMGGSPGNPGSLYYDLCASPCDARFNDMTVLPDGRILAIGNIARGNEDDLEISGKNNTMAMRLLPDGTPDPSFGSPGSGHDGLAVIDHGPPIGNSDDVGTSLLLQGDKLVIAGYARATDPDQADDVLDYYDFALTRIGALDTLFGDGFE